MDYFYIIIPLIAMGVFFIPNNPIKKIINVGIHNERIVRPLLV